MFIYQEKGGYCYNSDTMFLYDFISKKRLGGLILDVGCGCGVLGLLIKERFDIKLVGIDVQKNAITLCEVNAKNNNLEAEFICDDFIKHDFKDRFDAIVSNPPFYDGRSKQSDNSSKKISRFDTSLPLEDFIKKSNSLLKPRGELIFCYDSGALQIICSLLDRYKFRIEQMRFIHPKRDKNATVVMISARKSSKSKVKCLPPLITHENGEFSDEVKEIYDKLSIKSLKCELDG
ncbi:MAG: methyltransferase [Epsilonproteobacteria bacterium]|nr:methyltransferase [Campylobacterota bacterium]